MPARKDREDIRPIKKGDQWFADFRYPDPSNQRKTLRARRYFPTKRLASQFIDQMFDGLPDAPPPNQLIKEYLHWSEAIKRKSHITVRNDTSRLKRFTEWMKIAGIADVAAINFAAIAAFQQWYFANAPFDKARIKKRYKIVNTEATWEKYRQNVSSFLNWCKKRDYFAGDNPAGDPEFKIKTQRKIPAHFNPEDLVKLFEYLDRRDKDEAVPWYSIIYRIFAYTGMRFSELANLTWKDVDLRRQVINLSKTKNKSPRSIPISDHLLPWINQLPKDGDLVLDNGAGSCIYTESWLLRHLVDVCQFLDMPRRRLHDFRHTFAVSLIRSQTPLPVVQRLLGHKHISSTMIYITFDTDDLRQAVDRLSF